ncbi:hypothetical protein H7849_21330 [Alloacidobacterium dinghuense]|uniref:Type I restriction modification DNA specificity domain-containing protein n=1 Tax=Alloacidobacterium dinghuense TaxID=2763107 RepID=A0A7G8BGB4_9BACT|nr:hypothetical protein [Alloacidobacterium dinghuense]QNI31584.1 hypothetical protein H7849_21330 [Alloacidobacterium dinghuense]
MSVIKDFYPLNLDELPLGWEAVIVGQAIPDIQSGFPSGIHNKEGLGIPHLRPMNVSRDGDLDLGDVKYVPPTAGDSRVIKGDVLFNNTNSPELIGKTTYIRTPIPETTFSNHMTRLRPPSGIHPGFVAYQLHFLWMKGYFRHRCTNHVNQASISSSALSSSVPLIVAPPEEQDRIVAEIEKQFTRLDAATGALKRVQANLKRYRASVRKAACEGRLVSTEAELASKDGRDYEPADKLLERILKERRACWEANTLAKMKAAGKPPKDDRWKQNYKDPVAPDIRGLPTLPEGWTRVRLDTIAEVIDPNPSHRTPKYVADGPAFVSAENFVGESSIDFSVGRRVSLDVLNDQINRFEIRSGAFVMSRYGTIGKNMQDTTRTNILPFLLISTYPSNLSAS